MAVRDRGPGAVAGLRRDRRAGAAGAAGADVAAADLDGGILAAIDADDGERAWKGGRYDHGQLVLLPEQDLLLVLSEEGELALVPATPDGFTELARRSVLEGKTWNHPVVVG